MRGLSCGREGELYELFGKMFVVLGGAYESASGRWLGVEGVLLVEGTAFSDSFDYLKSFCYGQIYAVL